MEIDGHALAALAGLSIMAFGVGVLIDAFRLRARGIRVPGVIVGGTGGNESYTPIFRFTTLDGRQVEVGSFYGQTTPPQPGERITVVYDPENVRKARILTNGQDGTVAGFFLIGFGLLFVILPVLGALDAI